MLLKCVFFSVLSSTECISAFSIRPFNEHWEENIHT